jgi:copper(I)-binding protein
LVGALVGVVVLAAGCGTASASNGATAAHASASPSGATRIAPVCTCGGTPGGAAQASAHVGNLDIDSGYAVSSVVSLEGTTTVAYMTIANSGLKPVGLIGAATPRATSVRLDDSSASGSNTEAITAVHSVPIAAGAAVALAPGSYHLTVVGLSAPLRIGDTLPLTLHFSGGTTVHITLPVEAR